MEDSCNDLCQFKGYPGCDTEKTAELDNEPNMSEVMDFLNTSCAEFGTSPLNNLFRHTPVATRGAGTCQEASIATGPNIHINRCAAAVAPRPQRRCRSLDGISLGANMRAVRACWNCQNRGVVSVSEISSVCDGSSMLHCFWTGFMKLA